MMSFRCYRLEVFALVTVGIIGLLFLLQSNSDKLLLKKARQISVARTFGPSPAQSAAPTTQQSILTCHENASVTNISGFASLPDHIKDFLRYKHCRDFPQLLDAPNKCGGAEGSSGVFLLLAIKSSPGNYERREIIRKTWGEERSYQGVHIRRLFLSGTVRDARQAWKMDRLLRLEAAEYGDVLQWAFHDSFFNLTLKQVLFYRWMESHCPGVRFVLNGDDDVFTNTDNIVHYLLGMRGTNDGHKHLYVGQFIANVGPVREKWSKYYVPEQVTASNRYPPYCAGGGILMSGFTSRTIYKESLGIELLPIDDVYLGMCLEKAGLAPASHMGIRTVGVSVPSARLESFDPCYYKELLLVHRFVPYEILLMWRAIHEPDLRCGKKLEVYQSL
uniref:Hexosyltransferase n=1 Tax=Pelusios castaneus TaxID=367368 RepID=A0A8C8SG41_9SAUR